jgi:RNA polymerase sigma-70 factor (ECF subfamily)
VAEEAVVVALAIAGDAAAYSELVRRRQGQIRNLLRRLSRDPALADDLSQVAFVQAWRKLRTLKTPRAFGGWLRKLTVNVWLQHARTRAARAETLLSSRTDEPEDTACDIGVRAAAGNEPANEATLAEQMDLDHALALLPGEVRVCIVLAYAERMSHREISEATGFPLGTVKSHIARGAARLRQALQAYG